MDALNRDSRYGILVQSPVPEGIDEVQSSSILPSKMLMAFIHIT